MPVVNSLHPDDLYLTKFVSPLVVSHVKLNCGVCAGRGIESGEPARFLADITTYTF